jgi:hypothetical protein
VDAAQHGHGLVTYGFVQKKVSAHCNDPSNGNELVNLIMELFPMSNISANFAFALLVVFASLAPSFARHGGFAATRNIGSSGAGNASKAAALPQPSVTVPNLFIPRAFAGPHRLTSMGREFK